MCSNSVDILSTLLTGTVSNADLIISKRAFRVYQLHSKKIGQTASACIYPKRLLSGDYCNSNNNNNDDHVYYNTINSNSDNNNNNHIDNSNSSSNNYNNDIHF